MAISDRLGAADPRAKLTLAEVCAELNVSRSTFYHWRAKGTAPKPGCTVRFGLLSVP